MSLPSDLPIIFYFFFLLEKIEKLADPRKFSKNKAMSDVNMSELATIIPSEKLQDDLISENEPDIMDGEQTWPTAEELQEAELGSSIGDNAGNRKRLMKKVPKGTSEYQASWILDETGEENDEDIDEDDDMLDEIEEQDEGSEGNKNLNHLLVI